MIGSYIGEPRLSARAFRSPAAHVDDLRDGKVWRFRQVTDTKLIWDAMK
ncbi:hypothetical protein [Stenomitos frigidus]|uniref:Uncharacterized protein n=1 Tax=Stenomitos frigidus AS-A4 TaxID=2933935 RepID=A0ABV0KSR8_9CYAN